MSYEPDDYRPRQDQRDAKYRRDYLAWVAGMSPQEYADAKARGLLQPLLEDHGFGSNFAERDLAETSLASEDSHLLDRIEPACDQPGYQAQHMDAELLWDIIRRLVGHLMQQDNARLALDCLALASGVAFLGDSMTAVGRKHGLSRAAVSKRCIELLREINLPPSRAMRPLTAREAYADARKESLRSHEL
jgi:hypothetical protein